MATETDENAVLPGYAGTRGLNFWEADADLRDEAEARLSCGGPSIPALREFGGLVGGRLGGLIEAAHKTGKLPRLGTAELGGARVPAIEYCPEQLEARRLLARAMYGRPGLSLHERMTLAVLSNYAGEGGITCPLAMTEGLIGLLETRGTPAQKAWLPKLRSDDPDWALTGGQFVTERQGGSNVSANETVAVPDGDAWRLTGTKWFCSNPGELWVTTAKVEGTPHVGLFLVARRLADGRPNGHRILRKKEIGGTRGKATVEVEYEGARAELIGRAREGLVLLVDEILSVSRLHVAGAALGFASRALLEAETFAAWRVAYGRAIKDMPSVAARLKRMRLTRRGMLRAFYAGVDAVAAGAPEAEALVPLLKVEVSKRATFLIREAQLLVGGHGILDDFSPLNRLADDAIVNEIWEGTHPILCGHAAKALRRPRVLDAFLKLRRASPYAGEIRARIEASRRWSDDEKNLKDEDLVGQAYELAAEL
ncbi:MAG: acyl-CoA dehydrogenase family protein [Elusimicrobia bacterium]|nr:acyl-CoA dehydrogenase family protein [Elusimicrobiota bacterium]